MRYTTSILSLLLAAVMVLLASVATAAPGPAPKPGKQITQNSRMSIRSRRTASSRRASNPRRPTRAQIQRSSQRIDAVRAGGRTKVVEANERRHSVERVRQAKRVSTSGGRPMSTASQHLPHDAYHVVQSNRPSVRQSSTLPSLQRQTLNAFTTPPFYVRINDAIVRLDAASKN